MTFQRLLLAFAMLVLAACSWPGETEMFGTEQVIPRPDGVLIVYSKSWSRDRWRLPMDHGSSSVETARVHQAFFYPADGGAAQPVPLDLAIDQENIAPGLRPDIPLMTWRGNVLVPGICRERADMTLDCSAVPGGSIGQVHRRIEDVSLKGNRLVLARGPDGSSDCAVDVSGIGTGAGNGWQLAHYPGRGTYLLDKGNADLPLYRLQCGQHPQRLAALAVPGARWTEVIDIAPGSDPANPRVLYSSEDRFETAILRDMTSEIAALDTGAIHRDDAFFLDHTGERIVLEDDLLERRAPGLTLTVYAVATGLRSRLAWTHAYAPWPDRP